MSEFWWAIVRSWLFSFSTILWKICCCRIFLLLYDSALVKQLDVWEMDLHQTLDYFDIQWCPGYKISPNYHPCVIVLDSYYDVLMLICSVCLSPNSWHCLLWLKISSLIFSVQRTLFLKFCVCWDEQYTVQQSAWYLIKNNINYRIIYRKHVIYPPWSQNTIRTFYVQDNWYKYILKQRII